MIYAVILHQLAPDQQQQYWHGSVLREVIAMGVAEESPAPNSATAGTTSRTVTLPRVFCQQRGRPSPRNVRVADVRRFSARRAGCRVPPKRRVASIWRFLAYVKTRLCRWGGGLADGSGPTKNISKSTYHNGREKHRGEIQRLQWIGNKGPFGLLFS